MGNSAVQAQRERALATAARAQHQQRLAARERKRDIAQRVALAAAVAEAEVLDFDCHPERSEGSAACALQRLRKRILRLRLKNDTAHSLYLASARLGDGEVVEHASL